MASWLLTVGNCYLYLVVASTLLSEIRNARDDILVNNTAIRRTNYSSPPTQHTVNGF